MTESDLQLSARMSADISERKLGAFSKPSLKELGCVPILPACPRALFILTGWLLSEDYSSVQRVYRTNPGFSLGAYMPVGKNYCLVNFSERQKEEME